ncbi:MAG: gfo/Idh/MocA family oxidoreductase [Verrucomicrobiales bacterium]|nr:gfo/Idh/MocA family oxidoreductase [Verrucomicrobiales bacterium]
MSNTSNPTSRRDFIKSSSLITGAALAAPYILTSARAAENNEPIKIGLIGCGGRGTGAASQALHADAYVSLHAVADMFPDHVNVSLNALKADKEIADKVKVTPETTFIGLDAYQKLLASGCDVVLLATPPGFRPTHLKAAVAAGKHVFCEKPMAVDGPGLRSVYESVAAAKKQGTALMSGFCWRYSLPERAAMEKVHEGAIGDIQSYYGTYNTGTLKNFPRQDGWTDAEFQLRNWMYFTWLSGDHIVEQAVHNIDKMNWAMKNVPPIKAVGHGGRQVRISKDYGHVFDHFSIVYDYPNEVKGFLFCRQQPNTKGDNTDTIWGTKGTCRILGFSGAPFTKGELNWKYTGEKPNMYQIEHNELFASIRKGKPINDGDFMVQSTAMAIMGRMAGYTGQEITWDMVMNSQEKLGPEKFDMTMSLPFPEVAMPGKTPYI